MSYGKLILYFDLTVRTGMHIGGSSGFSAIGAVDQPVVRDPRTGDPMIPRSSLKGKLRTLLAKKCSQTAEELPPFSKDDPRILRLFGSSEPVMAARLQFSDAFICNKSELQAVGLTEVKTENSINRSTCVANPRQIERVVAGTRFRVCVTYDVAKQE
ncbi:MAG: type III-A CRISPR-associated RAMP protein Csm3 [Oscillospiraceae bacterium]|nr:type III-A CRISPR-associated RAMP protein Csm3 [Oscillospiraceae bacterium]